MNILAYSIENNKISRSDGVEITQPPYLDFLLEENTLKVFSHFDYDLANLLKMIDITENEGAKLLQGSLYISPYNLKFLARKFLGIGKGSYFSSFSDANQYIQCDFTLTPLERAKKAQQVCQQVYDTLKSLSLEPKSLSSPASCLNQLYEKLNIPTADDMPDEVAELAYSCCDGNWVEAFKLGHWTKAYDYDINSAYPSEIAKLIDIRLGKWEKVNAINQTAFYGYYEGQLTINPDIILSPFILNNGGLSEDDPITSPTKNTTPTGTWTRIMTKNMIDFLYKYKLGTFEIEYGYEFFPSIIKYPLQGIVNWLYTKKQTSSGITRDTTKRLSAGMYGKFLQILREKEGDVFGDFFNPVYAAEIENNTKLKVATVILDNHAENHLIHLAVDGILTDAPLKLDDSNNIGSWRLSSIGACICAGTGIVALKAKPGTGDFSLNYDWLLNQIGLNPTESCYTMAKQTPISLQLALAQHKWPELGQLQNNTRSIEIGADNKRCYLNSPKCGSELIANKYDSVPWDCTLGKR